jgi:transposase
MVRRYGRGKGGHRVVDHAPLNTPKSTTILSSIRLDGELALTTFQGGTTGDKFLAYLKDVLIPTLRPGDIVVMDNLRTHHIQAVAELLRTAGAEVLYLPPYSPDLNPIEKMWSKVKAILRKLRVRTFDSLETAIRQATACVSASDCSAWFRCAGCCLF